MTRTARERLLVEPGTSTDLAGIDTRATPGVKDRDDATRATGRLHARIDELQQRLYAEQRRSLLVVLQGMDTSGKDGAVRHAFAALSPSGTRVTAFRAPTQEELAHDFLWRIERALPVPGQIGIFNRSHYEDVVVVRVKELVPRETWSERFGRINEFERSLLEERGISVLKIFLHISPDEQRERLLARLDDPHKQWKFNPGDLEDRGRWDEFQAAWADAIERCSSTEAPWFVVPADRKWYRNWAVSALLAETLEAMDPRFPAPDYDIDDMRRRLADEA
jgi:PPK2 family polyphosphate:nucleotide phosphotransferase